MKEYVALPPALVADRDAARAGCAGRPEYAASLPPKVKKPRKKKRSRHSREGQWVRPSRANC